MRTFIFSQDISVFFIFFAVSFLMQYVTGTLLGYDAFYHVRSADLYLSGEIPAAGDFFHWTRQSIWNGSYTDKDYFWHLFLAPLTVLFGSDTRGLILAGTFGTAITAGLIGLALLRIMRANSVRWPLLWALVMLISSDTIIWRLSLCRSYLFSILLSLIGWHLISRAVSAARGWKLALFSVAVIYTLAYTAPHLLLGIALIWCAIECCAGRAGGETRKQLLLRALAPAGIVALGIAVGVALHPHSLNTLRMWVIQNLVVPLHSYGASGIAASIGDFFGVAAIGNSDVIVTDLGRELEATGGRMLVSTHIVGLLLLIVPWVVLSACRARPSRIAVFASACTWVFFILFMLSERFAEYFFPFVALSGAMLLSEATRSTDYRNFRARHPRLVAWVASVLIASVAATAIVRPVLLGSRITPRKTEDTEHALESVKRHVALGEAIFHVSWDDFPVLFFFAPEYDYVVGLDPTFMYAKSPELYRSYLAMKNGEDRDGKGANLRYDEIIRDQFGMRYALAFPNRNQDFALRLQRAQLAGRVDLIEADRADGWRLYCIKSK